MNNEGSFLKDAHKDLKADFVIADPPFNDSDWKGWLLREDVRWKYGKPPVGNANLAWVQHFIYHLAPVGVAGFILANGSMSSNTAGEGKIRKSIIEADLVDCMIARGLMDHMGKRFEVLSGKAMVVCMSRRICIELHNQSNNDRRCRRSG